jgi:hypothetical protein
MRQVAPHRGPSEKTAFAFLNHVKGLTRKSAFAAIGAQRRKEHPMLDIIMLAIGLGFFALSVGYTIACDRL